MLFNSFAAAKLTYLSTYLTIVFLISFSILRFSLSSPILASLRSLKVIFSFSASL